MNRLPAALAGVSLLVVLAAPAAPAQEMTLDDIVGLLEIGVSEEEILAKVQASATRFDLSEADVERLRKAGASEALVAAIRREQSAPPAPLDLAGIRDLLARGIPPSEVAARIAASGATFDLTLDDLVKLRQEGLPGEVLREIAARRTAPARPAPRGGAEEILFDKDPRFRLSYPKGWHAAGQTEAGGTQYRFAPDPLDGPQDPEAVLSVIVIAFDFAAEPPDPANLSDTAAKMFENLLGGEGSASGKVEILEQGERTLGAFRTIRRRMRQTHAAGKTEIAEFLIGQTRKALLILAWTSPEARLEGIEGAFARILDSFEVPEDAPAGPRRSVSGRLTRADLIRMTREGVTTDEIVRRIRDSGSTFDLPLEVALELRRAGVATEVLREMRAHPVVWKEGLEADGMLRYKFPEGWSKHDVGEVVPGARAAFFLARGEPADLEADTTGVLAFLVPSEAGEKTPEELAELGPKILELLTSSFRAHEETIEVGEGKVATSAPLAGYRVPYSRASGERRSQGFLFVASRGDLMLLFLGQAANASADDDLPLVDQVLSSMEFEAK